MARHPYDAMLDGRYRTVAASKTGFWVERLADGYALYHGTLHEAQPPLQLLDTPKKCKRCGTPAVVATARGRAHHPQCEGWLDRLPDQQSHAIAVGIAQDLGGSIRRKAR